MHVSFGSGRSGWSYAALVLPMLLGGLWTAPARADFDACEGVQCGDGSQCRSEKQVSCGAASPGGAGGQNAGAGGQGGAAGGASGPIVCHAVEQPSCWPIPCEQDDECGDGEICFGTTAQADCTIDDPCPDEESCVVPSDGNVWGCTMAIHGTCMTAQRCEDEADCGAGNMCVDYRSQCNCPDSDPAGGCTGNIQDFGGAGGGDGLCVCECHSGLCVPEGQGAGGAGGGWAVNPTGGVGGGEVGGFGGDIGGASGHFSSGEGDAGASGGGASSAGAGGGGPGASAGTSGGAHAGAGHAGSGQASATGSGEQEPESSSRRSKCSTTMPGAGGSRSLAGLLFVLLALRRHRRRACGSRRPAQSVPVFARLTPLWRRRTRP